MQGSRHTLCVIAPTLLVGSACCAGLAYSADQRLIRGQTSFGADTIKQPLVPLVVFNQTVEAESIQPTGTARGQASQNSTLSVSGISASGSATPFAEATDSSGLLFGGSGTSVFKVSFTPDADGIIDLQGAFTSSGGTNPEFVLRLEAESSTLVSSTTGGAFDVSSLIFTGVTYTLDVSVKISAFAFYFASPVSVQANASFTLAASTRGATCPGDLNADGFVDDADFSLFAVAYNTLDCADPAMVPGCPADLNADGLVDDIDFTVFAPAYDALICP